MKRKYDSGLIGAQISSPKIPTPVCLGLGGYRRVEGDCLFLVGMHDGGLLSRCAYICIHLLLMETGEE